MPIALIRIIFGLIVLAVGLWDYSGRGRHTSAKRLWMFIWLVYAEVPIGLGFTLVGLAATLNRHPISDWLAAIGFVSAVIGIVVIFWHPKWMPPAWLRGPLGD
jgi:hypothetical protein